MTNVFADPIRIDDSLDKLPIGSSVEFLVDEMGTLSIEDVASPLVRHKWFKSRELNPAFGFTKSVYWVKFSVLNDTGKDIPFFLEHAYALVDDIRLYQRKKNGFSVIRAGDYLKYRDRPYDHRTFVFPLNCPPHAGVTYYLRQETSSAMYFPLLVWSPDSFISWALQEDKLLMFFYGMMIIMAFNYLCVYFLIRHLSYLYFSLFILSLLLFIMTQIGATYQIIMPGSPALANVAPPFFLCLANLFGNRFVIIFLQLGKHAPRLKKLVNLEAAIILCALILVPLIPVFGIYTVIMAGTASLSVASIFTAFGAGVLLLWRRERSGYIFTFISTGFFIGSILYLMRSFGVLPGNFVTTWSIVIGSSTILIVLSIAMVDRINTMRMGLKKLVGNIGKEVTERSIELLLSEVAGKVIEEQSGKRPSVERKGIDADSIQSLLDYQRDLTIQKLSHDINIISNAEELLEKTVLKVKEISRSRTIHLYTLDRDNSLAVRISVGIVDDKKTEAMKELVAEVFAGATFRIIQGDESNRVGERHVICIPVRYGGRTIGVGYCERSSDDVAFTENDGRILVDFSDRLVAVYENAIEYRRKMIRDEYKKKYSITSQTEEKIKRAVTYIREHYSRDISREGLAASLDISPNHLGKYFKLYTGKKINEYINELRIRDAATMLRVKSEESIITIAFAVGFESLSTFNRAFMKIFGVTPTEYRENK
jgi:AraC-like DNA-binding protein